MSNNWSLKASSSKNQGDEKVKKSGNPKKTSKVAKEAKKTEIVDKPKEIVFRKPDFIDKMATKTGMTKTESEAALSAVLEIITEVSWSIIIHTSISSYL